MGDLGRAGRASGVRRGSTRTGTRASSRPGYFSASASVIARVAHAVDEPLKANREIRDHSGRAPVRPRRAASYVEKLLKGAKIRSFSDESDENARQVYRAGSRDDLTDARTIA